MIERLPRSPFSFLRGRELLLKNRGFTMIELVLTITILAIVGISAIPAFVDIGPSQCDGASRKLVSDISYARRLAQNRNGIYGISFDASMETYTVYLYDPVADMKTTVTDPLTASPMVVDFSELPGLKNIDIQSPNFEGDIEAQFNSQGIPQDINGAPLTMAGSVVLSSGGNSRTITVQPNTGEVSYQ